MQTVGETVLGEETNAAVKDTVHGTVGAVGDTIGAARDAIGGVTDAVNNVNTASSSWGGVGAFMKDITSGNGTNMFGNLFSNIFSGKVSMMSMLGLVASALLNYTGIVAYEQHTEQCSGYLAEPAESAEDEQS